MLASSAGYAGTYVCEGDARHYAQRWDGEDVKMRGGELSGTPEGILNR